MSATDGAGVPEHDAEVCVVQIYPRPELQRVAYCPLQVSAEDTAKTVIQNTVITLGLPPNCEKMLNDTDCPLERVLLWPPEAQKWHPRSHGYYFIIQQQVHQGGNQEETSGEDYDDLCDLPSVTEDSILEALSQRFYKFKIYTYASNILIAVNPNKCLPVYYNPKYVKKYENQPLGKESPHIFAIADVAFRTMLNRQANQCIVISGESASGKTESSSYLIHCLTALSQKTYSGGLERTILGAGPVLEAFGNAKTAQNNNSSRFGKFIQLNYLESGVIRGYASKCFLSYHVFYYLLVGASKDDQKYFHLLQPQDYLYLKQEDFHLDDEEKLRQEYKRLHQAMEMVGFLPSTKKHIFSMLSAILHLGNVTYTQSEDTQVLEVGSAQVLSILCELLKVKQESLIKALTMRRVVTANDTVVSQYTLEEAIRVRDSMAKSLYSALFDWIIFHINHALLNRRDMEESISCLSIGVLDMFGFENLQKNSFEQLCINYTNEKMQYYITQHIFKLQQDDYISEDIDWQIVDYPNNIGCIQLISDKTNGLFDLLDMESSLPEATDQTLLDKLKQHHQDNPVFVHNTDTESTFVIQHFAGTVKYHIKDFRDRNTEHMRPEVVSLLRSSERAFLHCMVTSSPEALFRWGVLRATIRILTIFKNLGRRRAEFSEQLYLVLMKLTSSVDRLSSNSFTLDFSFDRSDEHPLEVFEDIFASYEKRKKSKGGRQKQLIPKNLMDMRSLQHIVGVTVHDRTSKTMFHPHRMIKPPTVSTQFQASLGKLLEKMEKANPFFIFCIRSNAEKKGMHFDDKLVLQQIKHMGLVQTVNIQKLGYSAKYTFKEFVEKFRMLLPKGATATSEHITQLFENMNLDKTTYQIGKTKVFLKEKERRLLQETLNTVVIRHIIILQRWFRVCLIRLHFLQKKDATLVIQVVHPHHHCVDSVPIVLANTGTSINNSLMKKELKRQHKVEQSPNRSQQPDQFTEQSGQRARSRDKRAGRGSPPPLNRPLSLPLDSKVSSDGDSDTPRISSLQRYKDGGDMKEKANRWKERKSEGDPTDESIRLRKQPRRKRRLAYARSGLMVNFATSKESEYWSFPLPPISPHMSTMKSSVSSVDVRALKSQREVLTHGTFDYSSACSPSTLPRYTTHPYQMPNQSSGRASRNPTIRISRATRAMEWNASLDREITNPKELRNLDEFLGNQVNELRTRIKELSPTESIFLTATMEFRETIKSMFSVQKPQIGYKDLMKGYQNKVSTLAGPKQKAEVSLVVNLFQSVLDGFIRGEMKRVESEPVKVDKRRKKDKCPDSPLDHLFSTYQVNIMQSCDLCGSYIWGMEKAYMCSACKLICHKKCLSKIITDCSTRCSRQNLPGTLHFGVQVCVLTSKANPVPKVVELLLMHVELNGLYTEGIYRKSGSACRARELHQILETDPEGACLDNYPMHTITGLVKRWLRELPDPLMTFSLYNDFLHALQTFPLTSSFCHFFYGLCNLVWFILLPLFRVAKEEEHNKMSPSSLAIVFAPCILRSPDSNDPFLGMKDVSKTTTCVEILITEQFRRYREMMQNIQELEYAEALAVNELKLRRQNTVRVYDE
uniref:Myosin IXb n=1 Tax=Sphaeramia orbicularis TaxID=375764 RepID=A0A672ZPJ9_9TELE